MINELMGWDFNIGAMPYGALNTLYLTIDFIIIYGLSRCPLVGKISHNLLLLLISHDQA